MNLLAENTTPMEKEIARIHRKMIGILLLLAAGGVWQRDFILQGVRSHVEITSAILLTFAFSATMAFIFIFKLNNEIVAFKALREMSDDIRLGPVEAARDPLWRFYRCARPGRVFQRPRLLGDAYELVTEELARTKQIRLSVEEMNTLISDAEQAISDEKSLISYLSGILVFMGLIGTFIGLLHMVASIGAIMGSLASTSTDAAESFSALLGAMQEPLKGMAAGFAASLFGLFSSLVVGLLGRFAGQAAGVLKNEFKSWLASVVEIGEEHDDPAVSGRAAASQRQWLGMVGGVLADYSRVAGSFDQAARLLFDMRGAQQAQGDALGRILEQLTKMQAAQTRLLEEAAAHASVAPALRALGAGVETMAETLSRRMETEALALRELLREGQRAQAQDLRLICDNHAQTATQLAEAIGRMSIDIDRRGTAERLDAAWLEPALERGVAGAGRALAEKLALLEARLVHIDERQSRSLEVLTLMASATGARDDAVGPTLEDTLSAGFDRLSQTMETAFSAYSSLLHVVVATMAKAAASAPEEATEAQTPSRTTEETLAEEFRRRVGERY